MDKKYLEVNRKLWNSRTEQHLNSEFYDNETFLKGKSSLNDIELELLGDLRGKKVLHLQCHFGQDSISLAKLGAEVTAVDLSDKSIETAKELATQMGVEVNFMCSDVYDISDDLHDQFDLVFTSYGAIPWLPNLDIWADIISKCLKKDGRFLIVEFHPVIWMLDDDFKEITYSYFNTGEIKDTEEGTYANPESGVKNDFIVWNHGLAEVMDSLINKGMRINRFHEYDYSPYNIFPESTEGPDGFFIKGLEGKLPLVYALRAEKE